MVAKNEICVISLFERKNMFWAKKNFHGYELDILEHGLDVATCFRSLICDPGYRRALAVTAGRDLDDGDIDRLSILVALHDIGKANAGFQRGEGGHLIEGVAMCHPRGPFGMIWRWAAQDVICQALCATYSHHGTVVWESNAAMMKRIIQSMEVDLSDKGKAWMRALSDTLIKAFPASMRARPLPAHPEFWHLYAGLLTMADQVGSDLSYFPIRRTAGFDRHMRQPVRDKRLDCTGSFPRTELSPREVFDWPEGATPTPLQTAMSDLDPEERLILAESETGSGKTEAALLCFRKLAEAGRVTGMYFGIPTRSSAVQIQRRVTQACENLWGIEAALAVPGYLICGQASGEAVAPFKIAWSDTDREDPGRWAVEAPRKYLSAPAAVGTIDQALYGALRRKWAHMRGSALSRSLLVVDEVHASDSYMNEILTGLVRDHLALGGYALLMSATLTTERRHQIFEACGATPVKDRPAAPYPCITTLQNGEQIVRGVPNSGREKSVSMSVHPGMEDFRVQARKILDDAAAGGRVLVIRNSVRAAEELKAALLRLDPDAPLLSVNGHSVCHHSRFASIDRKAIDEAVEQALGKRSHEPVIVIGTQTLEQSLDIDADILYTDICPIDVLLQRVGRLHRHVRNGRPDRFMIPKCTVFWDHTLNTPRRRRHQIGRDRAYPDLFMIEEVATIICEKPRWNLRSDNRELVDRGAREDLLSEDAGIDARGREVNMRRLARNAMLDRHTEIHKQDEFSNSYGSRLGDHPVVVTFEDDPMPSPIETGVITELQLPSWMVGELAEDIEYQVFPVPSVVAHAFEFTFNGKTFLYGQSGICEK